ncbi:MAG: high-potential iron-sulfur protein [Halobacteriales archaeon]
MNDQTAPNRRRVLQLAGVAVAAGLAGCGGGGTETETETDTLEPVPEAYRTATALDGSQRDPSGVSQTEAVNYQPEPQDGQQCSGCQYYIEDKNGDGLGACAIVEGTIDPEGYCVSYAAYEPETATDGG